MHAGQLDWPAYRIPRTEITRSAEREELKQTGVYLLFGTDADSGDEIAYVGQARERKNGNGVLGRVMEHFRQEKNEYFTHAVMLVTSDDSLGPTEISYLENAFHSRALAAGHVRTLNSNDPSPGTATEEKKADLEEFIAYATIAIGSLGYRIFEKTDDEKASATAAPAPAPDAEPPLKLDSAGARGEGRQVADGFVVLAGSQLRMSLTPSAPDSVQKHRDHYEDRIDNGVLKKDTVFSSPSAAAQFLMGASANGKLQWKTELGVPLVQLEQRELAE